MDLLKLNLNVIRIFLAFSLIFLVAFSQADLIIPKSETLILLVSCISLLFVSYKRSIIFNKIFIALIGCLLWRIFEYLRSPFFGDITVLSIPISTFSAIIVCFLLIPTIFEKIENFLIFYKISLLIIIFLIWIITFFVPDVLTASGAAKGLSLGFWHPNVLGLYTAVLISICIFDMMLRKKIFFNLIIILVMSYLLFQTNSRGGYLLFFINICALFVYLLSKSLIFKKIFINRYVSITLVISFIFLVYNLFKKFGFNYMDELSSSRLYILSIAIKDVGSNYLLGLGILPRGYMYGFDSESFGAGLDGVYSVIYYNEGLVGLFLFLYFHLLLIKNALLIKVYKIKFIYFVFLISILLHAFLEAHYWQRVSPATFVLFGMSAILLKTKFLK